LGKLTDRPQVMGDEDLRMSAPWIARSRQLLHPHAIALPYPAFGLVPFNAGQGWSTTTTSASTQDSPFIGVNPLIASAVIHHSFQTYLMYLPPGSESQWVPLKMDAWSFYGGVRQVSGPSWVRIGNWWTNIPGFQPQTSEPTWSVRMQSGEGWAQVS
jgi:hypothetical protein